MSKLKLILTTEDGQRILERDMFVDESTVSRHDIYGEMVEEMYNVLSDSEPFVPTPLNTDLSAQDEVFGAGNN